MPLAPYGSTVRALCIVALMVACTPQGRELPDWRRQDGVSISLPGNARFGGLPDPPYVLRARAALTVAERDQLLTLVVPCFHDALSARVGGISIPDVGDHALGEHRFLLEPHHTAGEAIDIELVVARDALALGFGLAPRLATGAITGTSTLVELGRIVAIADLGLIAVFALLFGLSYVLDRRRVQDGAFAAGALMSSVAPLTQLGVTQHLGEASTPVLFISVCGTNLAVIYFISASFQIVPRPRALIRATAVLAVLALPSPLSATYAMAWSAGALVLCGWFGVYVITSLRREARAGRRRADALALIAIIGVLALIIGPDFVGFNIGYSVYGGLHVLSFGAVTFTIAQAIQLGREQVARHRDLERAAEELRRQVAERSRELADALAKLPRHTEALAENRIIGERYRVLCKLGAGGMGTVYEVERIGDGQHFALKTLRGKTDTDLMQRFAREAQIAAEMSHPNLVPVVDVGVADGGLFLVMPLITGGSLESARSKFGDPGWATPLLRQIAEGLVALHARDIIHRDLKPGNVLVAAGQARIADFGLASLRTLDAFGDTQGSAVLDTALAETAAPASPLTQRGDLFGTPRYMAPELAAGVRDASPASDVFAFGVIAFEMLAGKAPFAEAPVMARLHGRAIEAPACDGLDPIIARCLATDPSARPTAAELVRALE